MKRALLTLAAAVLLWTLFPTHLRGWSVVTVCSSGCTTTSLQTALDSLAACGDTIQIKSTETQPAVTITNRGCTSGTPITVTSDRAATWLPSTSQRVTPSQLANLALIQTTSSNPAVLGVLDGSSLPPKHWKFIGIAFTTNTATFDLVGFNALGTATGPTQIADDITFDRCYWFMPSSGNYNNIGVADMIRGDVTNLVVKNSFLGDGFFAANESHGIRTLTSAGPVTATNNFITASGIPIFVGGANPSYPTYMANGLTAQYNYSWRPPKYNQDPAYPNAADYVSFMQNTLRTGPYTVTNVSNTGLVTVSSAGPWFPGSLLTITGVGGCTVANAANWRTASSGGTTVQLLNFPGCNAAYTSGGTLNEYGLNVCTKNLGEFKFGTGMTFQYNVGENSWYANQCQAQFLGFTDTLRTQWDSPLTDPTSFGTFSFVDTTHLTWTGTYRIGVLGTNAQTDIGDMAICVSMPTTGTECHHIASYSGASLVTSTAFTAAPGGTFTAVWISYTGGGKLTNVTVAHNTFKNVDQAMSFLGLSFSDGAAVDHGLGKNHTISGNLFFANTSYITGYKLLTFTSGEADYTVTPSGFTIDHNTFYYPNGVANGSFVYANGVICAACKTTNWPKFDTSAITNNLFGVSAAGGNGPISGDSVATIADTLNSYYTNTNFKNNAAPGAAAGPSCTGGNVCSGNLTTSWSDPFGGLAPSGLFNVQPASAYYHAGTDGQSIGADFTQLPMVTGCVVTANVLNCDLTSGINSDAKNTQPVVLEVSSSRNLLSDLGTYAVIASVDPTLTPGADLSTRSDVILIGAHLAWPLTGVVAGTTYYWRLQAYGDTETGSFVASSVAAGSGSIRSGKSIQNGKAVIH